MGNLMSKFFYSVMGGRLPVMRNSLTDNIRIHHTGLPYMIDTSFGLLDELLSSNVLSQRQYEKIDGLPKCREITRVELLLNEILEMPHTQQEQFIDALNRNRQSHVINYIKDVRTTDDDWPLYKTEADDRIHQNLPHLKDTIDCRCGLLDEMVAVDCISMRQKEYIKAGETDADANGRLLSLLRRRSLKHFNGFIDCLVKTKQHSVASLLAPDLVGTIPSVSEELRSRMDRNLGDLVTLIAASYGLIDVMYAGDCLTSRQRDFIQSANSPSMRNERLLKIISRGSATDFVQFLQCLDTTRQHHIVRILTEDGTVAHVVARFDEGPNTKENEAQAVESFLNLMSTLPSERREEYSDRVIQHLHQLKNQNCELLAMKDDSSIRLFFFCMSFSGLQHLRDIYASGKLKVIVNEIFDDLLMKTPTAALRADVLDWDDYNYRDCTEYLKYSRPKTRKTLLTQTLDEASFQGAPVSMPIDQLPGELRELTLMKAAGQIFVNINRMTLRAEIHTLSTICSVSKMWWQTLINRKHNKKLLKYYIYRTLIGNLRNDLSDMIDIECGLMDKLLNGGAIIQKEAQSIQNEFTYREQVGGLLDDVVQMCSGQLRQLFVVLRETGQQHVINYIRANGHRTSKHAEVWPLFDTGQMAIIDQNYLKLVSHIEHHDALLNELLAAKVITECHLMKIQGCKIDVVRNLLLLHILQRQSVANFNKFIDCVRKTEQDEIVSLLVPNVLSSVASQQEIVDMSKDDQMKSGDAIVGSNDHSLTGVSQHLHNIKDMIEIEYGLVDWLKSLNLLSDEQTDVIESKPFGLYRVSQLLDDVISWSHDQQEEFLHALDMTQQTHVVTYIRAKGIYSSEYGDNWPLAASQEIKALHRNKAKFIELTDSTNGLLEELFYAHFLSYQQIQQIDAFKTEVDRNEKLYSILCRKSIRDFRKFIEYLLKTGQAVIASVLAPNKATKINGLSDEKQSRLRKNWLMLTQVIEPIHSGLLSVMLATGCITRHQKQFIESATSVEESNAQILNKLIRGSEQDYSKFIDCLNKTGQQHVASILSERFEVFQVPVRTSCNADEERLIIESFKKFSTTRRQEIMELLVEELNTLRLGSQRGIVELKIVNQ